MKEKEALINSLETLSLEIENIYNIMIDSERDEDYYLIVQSKNVNESLQALWKAYSNKEIESLISLLKTRTFN